MARILQEGDRVEKLINGEFRMGSVVAIANAVVCLFVLVRWDSYDDRPGFSEWYPSRDLTFLF